MNDTPRPDPREFTTTHWSVVRAAQSDEASRTAARQALEQLCRAYWYPLYAFVRHRGHSPADAEDLTQTFFARFIETGGFASAQRERGRFRSYLLGSLKHFLANEWHRGRTHKRGGGVTLLEWDALDAEARYGLEPRQSDDWEKDFDRGWALEAIGRAREKLRAECENSGKAELFQALKGGLTGDLPARDEMAARLKMSAAALKVALHRLRRRYGEFLRQEIARTVAEPAEVDEELRYLIAVLRG